jgi:heme exporter protein C
MANVTHAPAGIGPAWGQHFFFGAATALFLTNLYLIFFWVPTERVMGIVQRIFYFHVPIVWMGFLSFLIVFIASIAYLVSRTQAWDRRAAVAAEVGTIFMTAGIITGAIWAKPVWGTWWTWDPKLTTTFILWVTYLGYLMVRNLSSGPSQAGRYSAVIGIIGFVNVPIVYMASAWWRTLHPELLTGPFAETGGLESSMRTVLYFSTLTFAALLVYLLRARIGQRRMEDEIAELRRVKPDG